MISVIVDFLPKDNKTNKTVARFILDKLPILSRYMNIHLGTSDDRPKVNLCRPIVEKGQLKLTPPTVTDNNKNLKSPDDKENLKSPPNVSSSPNPLENNPFASLAESDDEKSNNLLGPPIEDLEDESLGNDVDSIQELNDTTAPHIDVETLCPPRTDIISTSIEALNHDDISDTSSQSSKSKTDILISKMDAVTDAFEREHEEIDCFPY